MLHVTTQEKTHHHHKAIVAEISISIAMLAVFFVPIVKASDITVDIIIKLVNDARKVAHVAVLEKNDMLQKAAEEKAQDMIDNNYFAHISPQGKSPWDWINKNNYDYRYAGENLAINFTNAEEQQKAWMESPTHKKNILNANYNETGVAVKRGVIDGHETIVVVQMFGKKMQEDIAVSNISGNSLEDEPIAETDSGKVAGASDKMKMDLFFKNNYPTLIGWFSVFGLAILLIVIDMAAIVHKKHDPMFILNKTKSDVL